MKRIKFRFSYFILLGIIGFFFQFITFFSFADSTISKFDLVTKLSNNKFYLFISNNYLLIVGCILVIMMMVGYILGKKNNNHPLLPIGIYGVIICESVIAIATCFYLIYASIYRIDMFDTKFIHPLVLTWAINVKNIFMLLNFLSLFVFSLGIYKVKNNTKQAKFGITIMSSFNAIAFILLILSFLTSSFYEGYSMLSNLYEINQLPPFEQIYPSINGFTLAQLKRLMYIVVDVEIEKASIVTSISAIFSISILISYLLSLLANLCFLLIQLIESYDVIRDENWKEI